MKSVVLYMLFAVVHLLPQDERISAKTGLDARIVYGRMATDGQFPWHVAVITSTTTGKKGRCGGSLIHPQWVLTAGQCLEVEGDRVTTLTVMLGTIDIVRIDWWTEFVSASDWFAHKDYNSSTLHADIGLIKLDYPIKETEYIKPIKLGSRISNGTKVQVPGFGHTENSLNNTRLYYAKLTTISFKECQNVIIDNSVVCTKISSKNNICHGDSGGGLVRKEKGEWELVGVATFPMEVLYPSIKCKSPSRFTRISSYKQWIFNETKMNL